MTVLASASSISNAELLALLLQIGLVLVVAVGLGRLAARVGLPAVVGELTAGVVLGPSLFDSPLVAIAAPTAPADGKIDLLLGIAQIGVLLLIALTGAHVDLGAVRRNRRTIALVGTGSVVLPLAAGIGLGLLLPVSLWGPRADPASFALFVGVAIAVSALPVIAKTLIDLHLLHRDVGQLIVGTAAISDIVGWMLLSVVSAMVVDGVRIGMIAQTTAFLLAALLGAALLVRPLARAVLTRADRSGHPEVGTAAVVILVVACSAATLSLGMEPILGAFLCGLAVGSLGAQGRRPLESLRPLVMSVLAPLFFATAGLQLDLSVLGHVPTLLAAVVVVAVATLAKLAGGYAGARVAGLGHHEGVAVGAGLNARGVVEIVLATVGLQLGVLSPAMYTIVVVVAVATSVMAPPLLRRATRRIPTTDAEIERGREFSPAG